MPSAISKKARANIAVRELRALPRPSPVGAASCGTNVKCDAVAAETQNAEGCQPIALKAFARRDAQVGDVDQRDAGSERSLDGPTEGFGGDAGVWEVAVEEAGGAGYLVE